VPLLPPKETTGISSGEALEFQLRYRPAPTDVVAFKEVTFPWQALGVTHHTLIVSPSVPTEGLRQCFCSPALLVSDAGYILLIPSHFGCNITLTISGCQELMF
jgi:hypothetical protein